MFTSRGSSPLAGHSQTRGIIRGGPRTIKARSRPPRTARARHRHCPAPAPGRADAGAIRLGSPAQREVRRHRRRDRSNAGSTSASVTSGRPALRQAMRTVPAPRSAARRSGGQAAVPAKRACAPSADERPGPEILELGVGDEFDQLPGRRLRPGVQDHGHRGDDTPQARSARQRCCRDAPPVIAVAAATESGKRRGLEQVAAPAPALGRVRSAVVAAGVVPVGAAAARLPQAARPRQGRLPRPPHGTARPVARATARSRPTGS